MIKEVKSLGELVTIKTGKLDSNAMEDGGQYPFFTCAKEIFRINSFAFDSKAILLAGNNASGDFNVKYYEGKFNAYQRTYVITINNEKEFDYTYLRHKLEGHLKIFKNQAIGANTRFLKVGMIKDIRIPLPSLQTQKKIAQILDQADALRKKTQQIIDEYDKLAQSIFLDMFGDPVTNPKRWEKVSIKSFTSKIGSGATPKGGKESYLSEGISLIRSLNIHDGEFKYKELAFISDEQADKLKNVIVEKEDVLFNITGASVCRCAIVPAKVLPARVNQHVAIIRCKRQQMNPVFLSIALVSKNVKTELLNIASKGGATREAVTKEDIEKYYIIKPNINLQNQFEEKIKLIEQQKELAKQSLKESEDLFNALLQKAFKGGL